MKRILITALVLFVFVSMSSAQSKNSYHINNVNNVKKILYKGVYYEVDTTTVSVKVEDVKKIPFNILRFNKLGYVDIKLPSNIPFDSAIRVIETDNNISKIIYSVKGKYNALFPNDNLYDSQWGLRAINLPQTWDISTGGSSVIVGVIDSGVDWLHPDLGMGNDGYHNFHTNLSDQWGQFGVPTSGNGVDDDNNGLTDDYLGWNYENNSNDCRTNYYHGTFVSGIIAAKTNNNSGIAGVAGGNNSKGVRILPYCVGGYSPISSVIDDAIIDAVDKGAKIIQLSFSILQDDDIDDAIQYAYDNGVIVICAAGNYFMEVQYPANNHNVVAVGAIDSNLSRADFSSYDDSNVNIVAPGVSIKSTMLNSSYDYSDGTSFAAPHVSGVAALVFSVNPNLTGQQVRDILESTAQKLNGYIFQPASSNHPNGTWNDEVGYGLVDAYAAVQKAMPDLLIRDTLSDNGSEPSTVYYAYNSPDIWTTDLDSHVCNPTGGEDCYVCVRVHNNSDYPSSGNEKLIVNWAKAGVGLYWNYSWTGNSYFSNQIPRGGFVTSTDGITIPSIPAGRDTVLYIRWHTPDPEDYSGCTEFLAETELWHFCLAARVHDGTPIAGENDFFTKMGDFTRNNNDVAWKNISIISDSYYSAIVNVSNPYSIPKNHTLDIAEVTNASTPSVTNYAEVYITLDAGLLAAINSNANIIGLDWVSSNTLRWNGGSASIPVTLPANSDYTLKTTVHFIADQIPASNNFDFDMVLRNATGDSILGGEHYRCVRTNGRFFQTCISRSESVLWGEPVTLTACDIEEDAEYIWYDNQGEEVGCGLTCDVAPLQPTTYTLRVTADEDGYRTYCQLTVNVTDGELRLLAPNPADNQVRIGYALSRNVSAATLQILNGIGQVVYSQALSGGNGSKVTGEAIVNTSSLAAGSYTVRLVSSNGKVHDSKTLVVR